MRHVLFVCVENSCRSQMAEAFGKMLGKGVIEVHSSGSRPYGKVNEKAVASMKELGYDLGAHASKALDQIPDIEYDLAITMGCGDECPCVKAIDREDWNIPDPRHLDTDQFREARDLIGNKVAALIEKLKSH